MTVNISIADTTGITETSSGGVGMVPVTDYITIYLIMAIISFIILVILLRKRKAKKEPLETNRTEQEDAK